MTRDDIIRMAREAWLMDKHDCSDDWFVRADIDEKNIFEFAALVAAAEREACATVCEGLRPSKPEYDQRFNDGCTLSAAAIRARWEV